MTHVKVRHEGRQFKVVLGQTECYGRGRRRENITRESIIRMWYIPLRSASSVWLQDITSWVFQATNDHPSMLYTYFRYKACVCTEARRRP